MSIINFTYFKGEIYIGQLSSIEVQENLQVFIDKYENEYLETVYGDMTIPDPLENMDILQAIAHYVYFFFVRSEFYQRSGIGATIPQSENAMVVAPQYSAVFAWNEMVKYTDKGIKSIEGVDDNPFCYKNRFDI